MLKTLVLLIITSIGIGGVWILPLKTDLAIGAICLLYSYESVLVHLCASIGVYNMCYALNGVFIYCILYAFVF